MNCKYSETYKQNLVNRYLSGESAVTVITENNIPKSTFYAWVKKYNEKQISHKPFNRKKFLDLENKVIKLENMVAILQSTLCPTIFPLKEKLVIAESLYEKYSVHSICDALDISRGTFYNHIFRNKKDYTSYAKRREGLRVKIQKIYDENKQIFGAKKITAILKESGERISKEMVSELMRDMGLVSIRQGAKALYLKQKKKNKVPNLVNQNFNPNAPNEIWVSDITQFEYKDKWYYICVIMDLFSRKIIGYKISLKNSTQLVKATFKQSYINRSPQGKLIFHNDRGAAYCSNTFREYLESLGVEQSFSKSYNPYDNSVIESFFKSMKSEELYRKEYRSENEFKRAVDEYMVCYNTKRPHASLKYKTPDKKEADFACN